MGESDSLSNDIRHVAEMSEKVLRCLIFQLLEKVIDQESAEGQLDFSSIPPSIINEIKAVNEQIEKCGQCARCSDDSEDFNKWLIFQVMKLFQTPLDYTLRAYRKTFHKMVAELDLTDEFAFAYDTFVRVCKKMLKPEMTWYHVVALLCFAAEIAVFVIKQGGPGVQSFLEKIVHFVIEFIVKEEIAHWISNHGGWIAMVNFLDRPNCPNRAEHIFAIMSLNELTHLELWLHRLAGVAVIAGFGITLWKIFHK